MPPQKALPSPGKVGRGELSVVFLHLSSAGKGPQLESLGTPTSSHLQGEGSGFTEDVEPHGFTNRHLEKSDLGGTYVPLRSHITPFTKLIGNEYHTNTLGPTGHTSAPHLPWPLKRCNGIVKSECPRNSLRTLLPELRIFLSKHA